MKPFYKNLKFITAGILTFLSVSVSDIAAQTLITTIGTPVSQDFDAMTPAGTWTNGSSPLSNWYAKGNGIIPTSFILNNGSTISPTNTLSSFGTTGAVDRAIGFIPGGITGTSHLYGWRLKNNLATTIYSLSVSWTLEQWRKVNTGAQSIELLYQISPDPITAIPNDIDLYDPQFSLASPIFSSGTGSLDGNIVKVSTTTLLPVVIPPGSEIMICWKNKKASANHLMAIDDVSVTAKADQTITFGTIGQKAMGDGTFSLSATASSGLTPVTFTSSNENVATISGNTVTIVGPGSSTITAFQAGNSYFNPATTTQGLNVKPSTPTVTKATSISPTSFTANWTVNNGLNDAAVSYIVEYSIEKSFEIEYDFYEPTVKTQIIDQYMGSPLNPNTIYFYRVYSLADGNYSLYSEASAITTGTNYVTVNSGNWDTGANWDVGTINNVANSITIAHPITLNTSRDSITTNTLVIKSGGKLTTNQRIHVTNELIIEVGADGTAGQILNTANVHIGKNAKVTIRKTFASGEWAFIGFPFNVNAADVHIANTETTLTWGDLNSGANFIVQQYDGEGRASAATANYSGAGLHWANVSPKVFTAKKGYIVYNNTGNVIDFTSTGSQIGTFFSRTGATVSTIRPVSSMPEHSYWNLVTTPLSSLFNLGNTSPGATYYAYNGVNYLPALAGEFLDVQPFASFFLQASSTSISFANVGRKVLAATRNEQAPVDDIRLTLSNGDAKYNDITRIRLQEGANPAYEIGTDAAKMFGMNANVSYIYTKVNNTGLAINTLPKTISEVELTTKFAKAGNYSISISDIENVQSYSAIILIDKTTGKSTDLLAVGSYDYNVTAAGTVNRFKVQLAPKITTGVSFSDDQSIRIATQQNEAIILGLRDASQVSVFDTTGKTVFSGLINNNEPIRFENKGLYIFEIATPEKTIQIKSFVR